MDFLDDPFSEPKVTKAPIAGRFQPKAKPRLKKVLAAAVKATKELPVKSVQQDLGLNKPVQPNIIVEKKSDAPSKAPTTDNEILGNSLEDGNLSAKGKGVSSSADNEHSEIVVSSPLTTVETTEEQSVFPSVSFASASPLRPCNSEFAPDQSIDKILQDSVCYEEPVVSDDGDFQIDVKQLGAGDFSCLDSIEKRAVKLLPKPKAQGDRQNSSAAVSHLPHAVESLEPPSEHQHVTKDGSIHVGKLDTASDAFHIRLDDSCSLDPSMYQPDTVVSDNTDSLMPGDLPQQISGENHGERRSYDAFGSSVKSVAEGFLSRSEGNDMGLDLDGIHDGFHENSSSYDKALNESASNRVENNEGDNLGEEISQKKKPRKSKKDQLQKTNPLERGRQQPKSLMNLLKNLPRSFLMQFDEKEAWTSPCLKLQRMNLTFKGCQLKILLYCRKDAATVPPAATSERIDNMEEDLPYVDNEIDQYGDASDNPSTSAVQTDTGYFNYQTCMTKETRARWTKQDTELFYQGISQFGSDLSMVQQLFPGRTRHQIKLKYKKEERQNPVRLHDSLTGRARGICSYLNLNRDIC
ncbi:Transcription factor TFIIIB component B'', partial [Bienertia sinuspersici]